MAEPWTETKDTIVAGSGFARMTPITESGGAISAFGTKIDMTMVSEESDEIATEGAAKTEVISKVMSTGRTLELGKDSVTIDATTGYTKTSASEGGDTIEVKAVVSKAVKDSILLNKNKPVVLTIGLGKNALHADVGFAHIIGKFGNIKSTRKEDFEEITITVKGGVSYSGSTYSAFNSAATGGSNTITPVGYDTATTIKAITSDDYTTLLTGVIVRTAAS